MIRKSLVILPMGISIPPSMKAIMRMTMAPIGLLVYHSSKQQCSNLTLARILYLALKVSLFLGVFTKLANLPNLKSEIKKKKIYIYIYIIIEKGELYPKYELEITYESRKLDSSGKPFEG